MQWIKNKLRSWLLEEKLNEVTKISAGPAARFRDSEMGLNINVLRAIGGNIVTFNRWDQKLDRTMHATYIITDEQNFDIELGKIITLESMKL